MARISAVILLSGVIALTWGMAVHGAETQEAEDSARRTWGGPLPPPAGPYVSSRRYLDDSFGGFPNSHRPYAGPGRYWTPSDWEARWGYGRPVQPGAEPRTEEPYAGPER